MNAELSKLNVTEEVSLNSTLFLTRSGRKLNHKWLKDVSLVWFSLLL